MALTGPIPLPGNFVEGLGKGVSGTQDFFSKLVKQQAEQEQMDRLRQLLPFEKQLKQAQLARYGQEAGMNPLHKLLLQEQIKKMQLDTDPMAMLNYMKQLQAGYGAQNLASNGMTGGDMSQGMGQSAGTQGAGMPTSSQNETSGGNNYQALATFAPALLGQQPNQQEQFSSDSQQFQPQPLQQQVGQGQPAQPQNLLDAIKQNKLMRSVFEKRFPGAFKETPEDVANRQFDLFKKKEEYKQEHPTNGTQFSVDPTTGAISFSQGGRSGQTQEIVNGKLVSKPTTATSSAAQLAGIASEGRDLAAKHIKNPYMGLGSSLQMTGDLVSYVQDPNSNTGKEAGNRLVDAAVSARLVPEVASLQLASQGIKASKYSLQDQRNAIKQGWADRLDYIVKNLPPSLQHRVKEQHDETLKQLTKVRQKYYAMGLPIDLKEDEKDNIDKLEKRSFGSQKEFLDYLHSLTPRQQKEAKALYLGAP